MVSEGDCNVYHTPKGDTKMSIASLDGSQENRVAYKAGTLQDKALSILAKLAEIFSAEVMLITTNRQRHSKTDKGKGMIT